MNIHLHNYEEYFILYVDNELESNERLEVEEFVLLHPGLKEELDILSQYKLTPDTDIVFPGKEALMKPAGSPGVNYHELLLLYVDNELGEDQKKSVEEYVSTHPSAKEELILLQRSKLQPEAIHFPDKQSLYREEEKVRVIAFSWWKIAVAAILILGLGLAGFLLLNKRQPDNKGELVTAPHPAQKQNITVPHEEIKKFPLQLTGDAIPQQLVKVSKQPAPNKPSVEKKKIVQPSRNKDESPVLANNTIKPSNHLPEPAQTNASDIDFNKLTAKGITPKETIPDEITSKVDVTPTATQTSYDGTAKSSMNDDFNQSGSKKNKLRGFFRKLTRTFQKTTKMDATDENQVLIGGLAIKLK